MRWIFCQCAVLQIRSLESSVLALDACLHILITKNLKSIEVDIFFVSEQTKTHVLHNIYKKNCTRESNIFLLIIVYVAGLNISGTENRNKLYTSHKYKTYKNTIQYCILNERVMNSQQCVEVKNI
jgi:hypothetical protein